MGTYRSDQFTYICEFDIPMCDDFSVTGNNSLFLWFLVSERANCLLFEFKLTCLRFSLPVASTQSKVPVQMYHITFRLVVY